MTRPRLLLKFAALVFVPSIAVAQSTLSVTSAGPTGELSDVKQANEIRIRFSEPMVPLGRIPDVVTAPFVSIRPAITGTFRWAGPTILIFTPDPKVKLPNATRYDVRVDTSATAVSGRRLATAYVFSFTTPTVRLLQTNWYREGGRYDRPVVIPLRFNQQVRASDVAAHITLRYQRHEFARPDISAVARNRMGADGAARLDRKVGAAEAAANSEATVPFAIATDWDRKRFEPAPNLVVLRTTGVPATDGWMRLTVDERMPAIEGAATPPNPQAQTIQLEPTFLVEGALCSSQCDADAYNALRLRGSVAIARLRRAVTVKDITDPSAEIVVTSRTAASQRREFTRWFTLEDAGFDRQLPAHTYAIALDPTLQAEDGQVLGYPWTAVIENWHERAFVSFGDGHGVWERGGGALPFYARNFVDARQWSSAISAERLMPTIVELQNHYFRDAPVGEGVQRKLGGAADRILSHGLDVSKAISPAGTGLVWAAVQPGQPIPHARTFRIGDAPDNPTVASIVQVTNLGVTVKDSPQNTLVFVTRLDTGAPVPGANVSIIRTDNSVFWKGTTDANGIVIAPETRLRKARYWRRFAFIVTAEKDGDIAYTASDWNEGISPWEFGTPFNLAEAEPLLRGTVFSDRGVYKAGEEIHFKGILRTDTPTGITLIPSSTPLYVSVRDSRGKIVDTRSVTMNQWSTTEWTMKLAPDSALGNYQLAVSLEKKALEEQPPRPPEEDEDDDGPWLKIVHGGFLVAAYRRPDFRVDTTLTGDPAMAGAPLKGAISGRYLFGAPMAKRPVTWTVTRSPNYQPPIAITNSYPGDRFVFVGCCDEQSRTYGSAHDQVAAKTGALDDSGRIAIDVTAAASDGLPYAYTLEGDVEDVSRQHIAGRSTLIVHPAPWYIGLKRPNQFVRERDGLTTAVVAATPDGKPAVGVPVELTLVQQQWNSVRRAEGNGFYTWDVERKEIDRGHFTVTTGAEPVALTAPLAEGGSYVLRATAKDDQGHIATTRMSFYVLGSGYTAWARYDHNRIDLVPEKDTYRPGETARIMIQSPWERATALLTVEREGIRSHTTFALASTQQTVTVPIAAKDVPNLFVSVLLIKGRTPAEQPDDASDPGKPSFRIGYARLNVEDPSKRLTMTVKADHEEFRPAGTAKVNVAVVDRAGQPAPSEVTLWAVDYGVLSLTGYRTPDVVNSVYVPKSLQVLNSDNRQRIISRRVLTPKGTADGGGGGVESGVNELRKDFRVLAFWLGSIATDSRGRASVDVKLPESLTTYRIMAVSGDKESRFGSSESEIRINKPVVLRAAFPRFLARGDKAYFGSVVTSQLKQAGTAIVTMRSLDPSVLQIAGEGRQIVQVPAGGSSEVRFDVVARQIGRARVQTTVRIGNESDAFEDAVPVEVLSSAETVAAYGEASPDANQTVNVPTGIVPGFGGLRLEVASTALVGLGEGARYVVEYPFGCAEQRASRAFVLALTADLGDAFRLPGIDPKDLRSRTQTTLNDLQRFQCPSGGFAFWPGACLTVSPYLTSYVLHVYQVAGGLGYSVDREMMQRGYTYLERELAAPLPVNEEWWTAFTAWEAFAAKVLVEGGRNADSTINRLYQYRDRMPVFALAYLYDSLVAKHEAGPRLADLRRRMANAMLPEAGSVHVEELNDPYLLWFWNSNVRSSSVVLDTLIRSGESGPDIAGLVRWLLAARKNGRWDNTHENAWALHALVSYYRKFESRPPDFTATVRLGAQELLRETFKGRSTESRTRNLSMAELQKVDGPRDLTVLKEGDDGILYYSARLTYAPDITTLAASDKGFHVDRRYAALTDGKPGTPATSFKAGDLIQVTLAFDLPKERRYVAVSDPLPAGFEAVDSWFQTTAAQVAKQDDDQDPDAAERSWLDVWRRGTFDHVERHDDRVLLFATRLAEGHHEFSYVVRATTAGAFQIAPARAEEMYAPEVFGRTASSSVEVKR